MKNVFLGLALLLCVVDITNAENIKITVEITQAEKKALETDMISIQAWLQNIISMKVRCVMNEIIEKYSDKQASKMTKAEKEAIITNTNLETAVERNERLTREMLNQ